MKFVICVALIAMVSADEKKPLVETEKKPEEHKPERGLEWPLPDPTSEGDLLLHANINYERVRSLHKIKVEDEVDKMILAHGRRFLRRVATFLDESADFKIMPVLCRDSRNLNNSNRWRIDIPKPQEPAADAKAPAAAEKPEAPKEQQKRDAPPPKTEELRISTNVPEATPISTIKPTEKPNEKPLVTEKPVEQGKDQYEVRRGEFYREVGTNFARLLMKEYRKEQLIKEETEYLARWISDEAVHIGAHSIYCHQGEDVKEIKKQLVAFLDEKQQ